MTAGRGGSPIGVLFFDIGGVLLSNGWDRVSRRRGAEEFGLDWDEFQDRHELVADDFETGRVTIDEYLTRVVFHRERAFTRRRFTDFMLGQSRPYPESLAVVRSLAAGGRYLLATLNNESREINEHRIATFRLGEMFSMFLSSCYLGVRKPHEKMYRLAVDITQRDPADCVFVDDRALNLECAALVGMQTIEFTGATQLQDDLAALGVTA